MLGLNTVCDVYFAGAIDILCDTWNLTPDVAGAAQLHLICQTVCAVEGLVAPSQESFKIICSLLRLPGWLQVDRLLSSSHP